MLEGIAIRLTHTGAISTSVLISDVSDGVDFLNSFRKPGPVYVPPGTFVELLYTTTVQISYEIGAIRTFIDNGLLTAVFVTGPAWPGVGGNTLQQAYVAGNTIVTNGANGDFDVSGTETIFLNSSGSAIGIGTDADANPINIGTGAAARAITIGNVTGATSVDIDAGSGDINLNTDTVVTGKLTVTGLIDPPGLTMSQSAATPGVVAATDGTVWVRDDAPNTLMFTDGVGTDHDLLGASTDHQTARIIVGNAPAGDTATSCDFLDTGNGAGIAAALTAAAAALTPTDLYIKSGTYDFTLGGAPALPLTIPTGLLFRGGGSSVEAASGTIFTIGSTQRALFVVSNHAELEQFSVSIPNAAPGAVGTAVLDMGTNVTATDVTISIPGNLDSPDESLTAAMRAGTFSQLTRVNVQAPNYTTVARILSGIEIDNNEVTCDQCVVNGLDYGFRTLDDNRCIFSACRTLNQSERGFWLVGNQNQIVGCFVRNFGVRGIVLENGFGSTVTSTTIQSSGGLTALEIEADHDDARIINNTFRLGSVGIEVNANSGTLIGPNKFSSVLNTIVIAGGATGVTREVPTIVSDTIVTANDTAEVGEILRYDASGGTFTLSGPSSAARGDEFGIKEMVGDATVITVSGNGNPIEDPLTGVFGVALVTVGVAKIGAQWVFDGTTWIIP